MHHPGPPRFCTVDETVELAPRNPDPDAEFAWRLIETPAGSDASLPADSVVHLRPDVPGRYRAELDAPDGTHEQLVRVYPAQPTETVRFTVDRDDLVEGDAADVADSADCVVIGAFNDFTMGTHWATATETGWAYETDLPPGTHEVIFAFDEAFEPFATDQATVEGAGRPRIELQGRRTDDQVVLSAAARSAPSGAEPAVEFYLDDRDTLPEAAVTMTEDELRVPVEALPELARVHAVAVAERHSIADTLTIRREGSDIAFVRPADPPNWASDATIYEIFVREFVGDIATTSFEELRRRVPYIASLGVDVVWFTPIVQSPTHHGYHATNLFETATDLGTHAEFESLVETIRDAGMRVVFDLVINHTSRDHPHFQFQRAGVPGYGDYYERVPPAEDVSDVDWAGDDAPGYYFNWTNIPNVNYDSLAVRQWMLDVVDKWAPVVDGFRCDVAWGVPHGFWKEVRARVKADDPEFLLLDETVPRDAAFAENEFDIHYDTDCYGTLRDIGKGNAPASALFDAIEASPRRGYPDRAVHMRYIDNHDEDRYLDDCGEAPLRAAIGATLTLPGAPMIYAGQERGVTAQRGEMRWHDGDAALTAVHRRLLALRDAQPALRAPGVEPADWSVLDGDPDAVVAYRRSSGDETLAVILHFGPGTATVALDGAAGYDLLADIDVSTGDGLEVDAVVVTRVSASATNG